MKYALLGLLLCARCVLFAQAAEHKPYYEGFRSQYAVYHWTTSNGLSQSHVSGIAQTANKLLWIASYGGVSHFDGHQFRPVDLHFHNQKTSPFVTAIQSKGDSVIWATNQEIVVYYNKVVATVPLPDSRVFITAIRLIGKRLYFVAHDRIYVLDRGQLRPLMQVKDVPRLNGYSILTGLQWQDELFVLLTGNGKTAFYHYNLLTGKSSVQFPGVAIQNVSIYNKQLIAQAGHRWLLLDEQFRPRKQFYRFAVSGTHPLSQAGLEGGCFYYYSGDSLIIDDASNPPAVLPTEDLFYNNPLFASFRDHSGNLWLGTNSMGLFMFRRYPFRLFQSPDGKPYTNSSHAFYDSRGLLWFDDDCHFTYGMDLRRQQLTHTIANRCNWVNAEWSEDSLVLFAFSQPHYWYNRTTRKVSEIPEIRFPVSNCFALAPRDFIVAAEGQLYRWNGKRIRPWKAFRNRLTTCNQFLDLGREGLFLATTEGLYRYRNKRWQLYTGGSLMETPDFRSLYRVERSPYLLIGTSGSGILRFHLSTGKLEKLARIPAPLESCWAIVKDRFDQLWISSNNGITEVHLADLLRCFDEQSDCMPINHYQYENGLQNVEFNSRTQNKGALMPDGRLVFSNLGGPVIVTPRRDPASTLGQIFLERVSVNGADTLIGDNLQLREGDFVQLHFTLPCFASERLLNFEYRIREYRESWTAITNRSITLDNLPPGDYQLEIRLTSGDRMLRLPIQVSWKEPNAWLFDFILILVLVLIVVFLTNYYTRRVQERKNATNSLKQQLKMLEMEALRAQMNPHFIFNCLNTIQFLFISGNVDRANRYLSDFSSLMRMTLDLLRQPITTLELELRATQLYIALEQLQFDNGFEFRLIDRLTTPLNQVRTPTLLFQIFVENAILHGLKKTTEPYPILTITMEETDKEYRFSVGDNGPGIQAKKPKEYTSMGMKMLKERFNLKNEIYNWNINFYIRERETFEDDIRTEIIITFGKILNDSPEHENADS